MLFHRVYTPGGRWERILRALEAGPMRRADLFRAVRDLEHPYARDKDKVWRAIGNMQNEGLLLVVGSEVHRTSLGAEKLQGQGGMTKLAVPMILVTRDTPHGPFAVHLPVADYKRPDYLNGRLQGSEVRALEDFVTPGERLELRRAKVRRFSDGSFIISLTNNRGRPLPPYTGRPYVREYDAEER
jgi:hypothetical protein